MRRLLLSAFAIAIVGCGGMMGSEMAKPKDGQLAFPADYKSWPTFLTGVQKAEAKQVRDLYINTTGAKASQGQPFANGTTMVMELYKAVEKDGVLETGPDGKLVKGALAKIFIMSKGEGWGQDVPDDKKNGAWVYSAFGPDGKSLAEDFNKCRACHAPLVQKDFILKYDDYFEKRGKM